MGNGDDSKELSRTIASFSASLLSSVGYNHGQAFAWDFAAVLPSGIYHGAIIEAASAMTCIGLHLGRRAGRHRAFSLVELLVVTAIIGVLIAILLPAVQAAREAARRMQCKNHLKQLALAFITHQEQHKHFPTGGWGPVWVGDPDRGFDKRQPGGWGYNILPYIEQQALHDLGAGTTGQEKLRLSKQRLQTPLAIWHCPSRRPAQTYSTEITGMVAWYRSTHITEPVALVAVTDYAANGGDSNVVRQSRVVEVFGWPKSYPDGDSDRDNWPLLTRFTGITMVRSAVRLSDVFDGSSNTYLVGEKHLHPDDYYHKGGGSFLWQWQDLNSVYSGDFYANTRWVPLNDWPSQPVLDSDDSNWWSYGSPHASGFHMAFCDGSVRTINYNIDWEMHRRLSNRQDELPIDYSTVE